MQKKLRINIPQPCDADWQQMMPDSDGRYCSHCQKTVIDFTGWSDERLYQFLNRKDQSVCGRFYRFQLNRPIAPLREPNRSLFRMSLALGLTLIFAPVGDALARPKPPLIDSPVVRRGNLPEEKKDGKLLVYDNFGSPVKKAVVTLMQKNRVIYSAVTDAGGEYKIEKLRAGSYELLIECGGYGSIDVPSVELSEESARKDILVNLERNINDPVDTFWDEVQGDLITQSVDFYNSYIPQDTVKRVIKNEKRKGKNQKIGNQKSLKKSSKK